MNIEYKKKPLISVVIPVKNEQSGIMETLESVFKQDYQKYELVLVDGLSSDHTVEIAKRIFDIHDKPYRIVLDDSGKGIGHARNIGWKNSKGEYIAYIDAEVTVPRDWLSISIEKANNETIVACLRTLSNKDSFISRMNNTYSRFGRQKGEVNEISFSQCPVIKKEILEKLGGFDENLGMTMEDIELCSRLIKKRYKLYVEGIYASYKEPKSVKQSFSRNFKRGKDAAYMFLKHKKKKMLKFHIIVLLMLLGLILTPISYLFTCISLFCFLALFVKSFRRGLKYSSIVMAFISGLFRTFLYIGLSFGFFVGLLERRT